jgi:hypothetical protein
MKMATFGPVAALPALLATAVKDALAALGEPAKLVILYPPIGADFRALLLRITAMTDAPIVGATTGGAAFTERAFTNHGVVGAVLAGDDIDVQVALARGLRANLNEAIAAAVKCLKPAYRMVSPLVLVDAYACDGEALIETIGKTTPIHWRCFGGFAGDGQTYKGTKVLYNDNAFDDAAVIAAISSKVQARMGVRHGFRVPEGAKAFQVTGAEGKVLKTLDGRPAAEVYREELTRLGVRLRERGNILSQLVRHSLSVKTPFGEGLSIRAPLALGADGSISLGGSIAEGSLVRVVDASFEGLIASATKLTEETREQGGGDVQAQLIVDCGIRHLILGDRYEEQLRAFRGNASNPMLGFASYGEIARYGGSIQGFHNATAVTAVW